ncbi:MAG: hypothetical protein UZ22_OP11002000063 [Microgenomates bacterium OLB23]|nr:MAG: hypothetical protein UZ22_OP11002000063 [Microgenomates bacterium OLB23]
MPDFLKKIENDQAFIFNILAVCIIVGFSWVMSYYKVKDYYLYSEDLVNIGKIINTLTPADATVVTDRNGDTTLLYLAHRKGMPGVSDTLENLKDRGMQYFYTDKPEVAVEVKKTFDLIFENNHVFIFKL